MAKRFGGAFSPQPAPQSGAAPARPPEAGFKDRKPARHGARINLLFLAPLGVFLTAFFQPLSALAVDLAGAAVLLLAAWLLRDGIRAEEAYEERAVARRPAIPRKIFASALTALGVGLLVWGGAWNLVAAGLAGALAGGLHLFSFGLDPLRDKGLAGVNRVQTERVARKIEAAETLLEEMREVIGRTRDRQLQARVEAFQQTARQMFRTVEADPRDLPAARRYLGVYLQGARDASAKYAEIHARSGGAEARADYIALLDDLETNFTLRTRKMLSDDRGDLDVEISVLRDRLARDMLSISEKGSSHE